MAMPYLSTIGVACLAVLVSVLFISRDGTETSGSRQDARESSDLESLMQLHTSRSQILQRVKKSKQFNSETCATLKNQGSHFTVDVQVGTPGQTFSVVADTGSNGFWVTSCSCKFIGRCFQPPSRCFTGTNHSSTFSVEDPPPAMTLTYGSGPVSMVVANDVVSIGDLSVDMKNSLLLAIDHRLRIGGTMEGILGLGIPQKASNRTRVTPSRQPHHAGGNQGSSIPYGGEGNGTPIPVKPIPLDPSGGGSTPIPLDPATIRKIIEQVVRNIFGHHAQGQSSDGSSFVETATGDLRMLLDWNRSFATVENKSKQVVAIEPKSFLELAPTKTFSICFNDGEQDGALRIGTPDKSNALKSVGVMHWGLGFHGISIGNAYAEVINCYEMKYPGQETPCGAIPDSGTTLITVPKQEDLQALYVNICDNWDRCVDQVRKLDMVTDTIKAKVLVWLLENCGDWMTNETGLSEMPSLFFHLSGRNNATQTLELTPWAYILESTYVNASSFARPFGDLHDEALLELKDGNKTKMNKTKICNPTFDVMPYDTRSNGPIWILGTGFFYQFVVGYNIEEETLSFTSTDVEPCGTCDASLAQQTSRGKPDAEAKRKRQRPRVLTAPPRPTSINPNEAL